MASRETENNVYAKFWGDKQRALWYVMVFSYFNWLIASLCYAYEISFLYFFSVFHLQLYLGDLCDIYML